MLIRKSESGKEKANLTGWRKNINLLLKKLKPLTCFYGIRESKKLKKIVDCLALSLERHAPSFDFVLLIHCVFFIKEYLGIQCFDNVE